jgi:hypothetical protein
VDFRELRAPALASDAHRVVDRLVARGHVIGEAQAAAQVELAGGLDLGTIERDPWSDAPAP